MNIDTDALKSLALSLGKAGAPVAEQALVLALKTFGGPFGGIAGSALDFILPSINNQLGLAPDTPPEQTQQFVDQNPEEASQKLQAIQEDHTFQLGVLKLQTDSEDHTTDQQVALNTVQATGPNQSWLARNWRPMTGWGFGGTVMTKLGFLPLFVWGMLCFGYKLPAPPVADPSEIMILVGMLGLLSVQKTYEKQNTNSTIKAIVKK